MKVTIIIKIVAILVVVTGCGSENNSSNDSTRVANCTCEHPKGELGDYKCIDGKEYRCRENRNNVCEWELAEHFCPDDK